MYKYHVKSSLIIHEGTTGASGSTGPTILSSTVKSRKNILIKSETPMSVYQVKEAAKAKMSLSKTRGASGTALPIVNETVESSHTFTKTIGSDLIPTHNIDKSGVVILTVEQLVSPEITSPRTSKKTGATVSKTAKGNFITTLKK